jgi:hypothetical protein
MVVDALGQESWVQPFRHNCLKGFFRFWIKQFDLILIRRRTGNASKRGKKSHRNFHRLE